MSKPKLPPLKEERRFGHGLSSEQLDLLYGKEETIEARFWRFHFSNPRVYRKLVNLARSVLKAGYNHYSIDALFHRLRWHVNIEKKSKEPFKLNDHYTSFYSRLIAKTEPDLNDFFETREQRSRTKKA